ncbi:hypothetical protein DCC79_11095 [bacterium]|nr:hypothetical protein [Chloroflexi bacterium CFX6]RIL09429.1 MAG: hypothetical protein DCC79_11095 [bacterium]
MQVAFFLSDAVAADPAGGVALDGLVAHGIEPIILVPSAGGPLGTPADGGWRQMVLASDRLADGDPIWSAGAGRGMSGGGVAGAFVVCRDARDAACAAEHGCRVVIVLGDRLLDEVMGPEEPVWKDVSVAPDLAAAARYVADEVAETVRSGPFPFQQSAREERPAVTALSAGDMAKVFGIVVSAGVAVSLGITYLLRDIYQTYTFPPIAYWLTFQFIDQTWRGILFLLIGTAIGLLAPRLVRRVMRPPSYR